MGSNLFCSEKTLHFDDKRQQEVLNSIKNAIWQWIQCEDVDKLGQKWDHLTDLLLPSEVTYISENWLSKTHQCLHIHTSRYRNLGCRSTQRTEGTHPALKAFLDLRHNLDEAVRHLIRHFNKLSDDIDLEENRSRLKRHHPLHLDCTGSRAFSLEGHVTLHCLELLKTAWIQACSQSNLVEHPELPCTKCSLILQHYLPCQHYLRPFALLQEPIPLHLIHPRWYIDSESWDPTGQWKIPVAPLEESSSSPTTLAAHISDHCGQQKFVDTAYQIEEYLVQQPAHIAAERSREFQQTTTALRKKWDETHLEFNTLILPTPPVSFRTQFRTSNGRISSTDPRQGPRRAPTGSELAENELHRQQVIDHANEVAENETQDVIVLRK